MTVSTTDTRISYAGNGTTTAFSFPYKFLADADLTVILVDSSDVETTQTLTTHYTVTGAGGPSGGTVTMVTAPASGETLIIKRVTSITQETDYVTGESFPAETHEAALDKLTLMMQEQETANARALTIPEADVGSVSPGLPAATPTMTGRFVALKEDRSGFEYAADPAYVEGAVAYYNGVTALRAATVINGQTYWLRYHTSEGDGGGGRFRGVTGAAVGTYTDDGGVTILPTGGDGSSAFIREDIGYITPEMYGAILDGLTDDTTPLQNSLDYVGSIGGGFVVANGEIAVTTITIPDNTTLIGRGPNATNIIGVSDATVIRVGDGATSHNRGGVARLSVTGYWDQGATTRTNSHGIVVSKSNRSLLHDIRVYSAYHGVTFVECSDIDCTNVHVQGGGTDRSYIGYLFPEQDASAIRNAVQMSHCMAVRTHKYGFRIISGSGSKFTACESIGVSTNDETEIGWYVGAPVGATPSPVQFMTFVSCWSDQNKDGAWLFDQGTASSMKDIQAVNIWAGGTEAGTGYGMKIIGGTKMAFSNVLAVSNNGAGIHLKSCTKCSIVAGIVDDHNKADPASGGISGIVLEDSSYINVNGINIETAYTTDTTVASIAETGTSNNNTITGNSCSQHGVILGTGSIWDNNKGVKTKGAGSATILSATSSIVVSHGLDYTPSFGEVVITPRDDLNDRFYVGTITSTSFTLTVATAVPSDRRFGWRIERTIT